MVAREGRKIKGSKLRQYSHICTRGEGNINIGRHDDMCNKRQSERKSTEGHVTHGSGDLSFS